MKLGTGDHDLGLKAKKTSEWLSEGNRVKIDLFLPGRAKYLDEKTSKIDKIISKIDDQINTLTEFRKTLINDIVTGKVRVPI